ncbi:MAG: lysophospholipid acyltransferase family protein [Rhizobacter sp.]
MTTNPFALDTDTQTSALLRLGLRMTGGWLGLNRARHLYDVATGLSNGSFVERALTALGARLDLDADFMGALPRTGPLVVAANHPRGTLDGLALAAAVGRVRPDVRVLANHLLKRVPEMRDVAFFVDPFGGPRAVERSRAGLRAAHLWLRRGGTLIVFPSGEVAARLRSGRPVDAPWTATLGRLAAQTGAKVVPAFIDGRNSRLFYLAGRLHPRLRTLLLVRELMRAERSVVRVTVGQPFSCEEGDRPEALVARARGEVERLGCASHLAIDDGREAAWGEVASLEASACLVSSGVFRVFCASADQIPHTLREIGRLRAVAFQAAGEGSGQPIDLDHFDCHYRHLFVWDTLHGCVVGAYRLGPTDEIVARQGLGGLYSHTLFDYGESLLRGLPPALELGRAFVRPEYQKQHQPLLLLWRGIGRFVARHPQYQVLFGPVSISASHSDRARADLVTFLEQHHGHRQLARLVTPRHPFRAEDTPGDAQPRTALPQAARGSSDRNVPAMPVLLRHYLRLDARLLGCSRDPAFGDVLDALMMVDLTKIEASVLTRYLGPEGAARFQSVHAA